MIRRTTLLGPVPYALFTHIESRDKIILSTAICRETMVTCQGQLFYPWPALGDRRSLQLGYLKRIERRESGDPTSPLSAYPSPTAGISGRHPDGSTAIADKQELTILHWEAGGIISELRYPHLGRPLEHTCDGQMNLDSRITLFDAPVTPIPLPPNGKMRFSTRVSHLCPGPGVGSLQIKPTPAWILQNALLSLQ